jgi:2,3-bisphosphoglycerate-independent phosphoglycerate mutase
LGYDPLVYSKGRSPLEAVSMGLTMGEDDTAFRCNLVSLSGGSGPLEERTMLDHSAGEIATENAARLIELLNARLGSERMRFHTGVSYRHCLLWQDAPPYAEFARPHDILGRCVGPYLPQGEYLRLLTDACGLLSAEGGAANAIWLWSPGKKPELPLFSAKYGVAGAVVAAVDLMKGIALCAGMSAPAVPGATGNARTDYAAKARAAIQAFEAGAGLVYIHIEAPDECGHAGDAAGKIAAIEQIDNLIVKPVYEYLHARFDAHNLLLLPDHPTPLALRTHTSAPVPFLLHSKKARAASGVSNFCERVVNEQTSLLIEPGHELLRLALEGLLDDKRLHA